MGRGGMMQCAGQGLSWRPGPGNEKERREQIVMFTDIRSKKVLFVCHCMLNQNAISDGTAVFPAAFKELMDWAYEREIGIVQMPCPELHCLGLDRGDPAGADRPVTVENTRIRRAMEKGEPNAKLQLLISLVLEQIEEYEKHGFEIVGIVGANRSPNCGVETTSEDDAETEGMGLFMSGIRDELKRRGYGIPMTGLKSSDDIGKKLKERLLK